MDGARSPGGRGGGRSAGRRGMRAPQERTVRDLYDRTRQQRDLAATEEQAEGRHGGRTEGPGLRELVTRMEDKTVRKRLVSNDDIRVKAESGTCNVCCAPCSSCLHRSLSHADANIDCGSSQTCSTRSEIKNNSLTHSEKGVVRNRGENDEEFSAASSNASFSETGGSKLVSRSSIAEDSPEVDMPAKRRRLSNEGVKLSRAEYLDDNNSCVSDMPAEGKLLLEKKKLSASASTHDLTVKNCKGNNIASHGRLRKQLADEPTEKNQSSVTTKKLLRMHSSASVSNGLSPKRQAQELGEPQENSSHQRHEKAWLSNNTVKETLGGTSNPCVDDGDNNDMVTSRSGSTRNAKKDELSSKDPERDTSLSKDQIQQDAVVQSSDDAKRNGVDKLDWNQDSSMDMSINGKLNIQKDVMIDYGNSEVLIDVNVCDICGDVGREYLLATCTRCLEGAEHTYCMRVKLDKVPDGEWLCEECHFKDDLCKTRCEYGVQTVNVLDGKKQCSENENNPKALQVVPNLDTLQINCNTATAYQCDVKNKKLHLTSADTQPRQVKVTNPVAERLEVKNKKKLSLISCKKLDVVTSELEGRSHDSGIPTPSSSSKKNQSSEFLSNRKKLRVCTNMESPLSSEGLQSPTVSCKRLAENASPPNSRLSKACNPKKRDVFSRENLFKKSNEGSLSSLDKSPMRTAQAVKSSQMLSRSYSMGSMANAKAPVSSPRGLLSKQLSFNSSNNGPKVKQLTEGVVRKLRPVKHSPKDTRDQRPIKEIIKSGSFKSEGLVCKDAGSSKQKQSFHVPQNEKSVLKSMKEENMMERRASFSFKKPNIPSSPRPVSYMKSGERKLDQDILRPGPSILKSSKKPGNTEKESYNLPKTDKRAISVHQKPTGFVSGKDIYGMNIPDPPVPSECVKRDSLNDGEEDDNGMPTKPRGVLPTTSVSMSLESHLHDTAPRASALEELAYKVVDGKQKPLESTLNSSCNVEPAQVSDDKLPQTESPHSLRIPADNKLYKSNLKQEAFHDQSTSENPSRDLVIPEQSYIWQGSFEVSRHGIPEIFDGIQAYLSTSASFKVREVGKQLPQKIQLVEAPRHSTWPLQFKEVNPTEDNIALFFFAKDAESYERAYIKLLEDTLLGDLSLTANIGGIELLIFPSDKLPQRTQRWNGSPFFWGVFYARKASSLPELPVSVANNCSLEPITEPVSQHDVCFPKAVQSLVIDLNECPNDDLSDLAVSLGPEMEKTGAPVDYNIWFESKHEDRKLNACEIHHEGTSGTRQIVSGHPTAFPHGTHFPKIPTGHDMVKYYPSAAKDTTGIAGNNNMGEEGFCQHGTLFCVAPQAPAVKSVLGELVVKNHAFQTSTEVPLQHFIGSKISDEPNKLISNSGIVSSDSDRSSKRQKTYNGKHSACSFDELPSKCMSKIHPLSTGQQSPSGDAPYICGGSSDLCSLKKPITDHVIHVLSSDDEESPKPSTRLSNKASLKADEGSSPLLSLSLSTVATKDNLAGSDIGEDEPLSLSLGLPGVVDGSQVFEMKQFLPEKPGINT